MNPMFDYFKFKLNIFIISYIDKNVMQNKVKTLQL